MLTKIASGVLAARTGSTYCREYESPLRLLRPCWTAFLNSLRMILAVSVRDSGLTRQTFGSRVSTICQVGGGRLNLSAGLVVEGGIADRRTNAAHLHG